MLSTHHEHVSLMSSRSGVSIVLLSVMLLVGMAFTYIQQKTRSLLLLRGLQLEQI